MCQPWIISARAIDMSQDGLPDEFLFVESARVCIREIFLLSYSMIAVKSFRRLDRERGKIENCHNAAVVMVMPRNIGVRGHRAWFERGFLCWIWPHIQVSLASSIEQVFNYPGESIVIRRLSLRNSFPALWSIAVIISARNHSIKIWDRFITCINYSERITCSFVARNLIRI